ncbi:glycosyltransferase [Prosthecobacter sp.]|uniref:glycosyltransferase n=1 Tax=Prosthecobacter sp. TaxID=1965333 RepID=UPI0024885E0C|nr:glycosyltransferase [Prosthecobacter sp.]MDI1314936.1 glycosyltransferase [Prosthecobacter sp.]
MNFQRPAAARLPNLDTLPPLVGARLQSLAAFYDDPALKRGWAAQSYHEMLARYYNLQIPPDASVLEIGCGDGRLLALLHGQKRVGVDVSERQIQKARQRLPEGEFHVQSGEALSLDQQFDIIVISETINHAADVQLIFERLHQVSHARTRLIINFCNNLWRPLSALAALTGMRTQQPETNWLSYADVHNLLALSGWEEVGSSCRILFPFRALGLEILFNRWLAPLMRPFCLAIFSTARPLPPAIIKPLTVSVIIPARNEAGNIEAAVSRTPMMGAATEIIFVEGHSTDNTWAEIQRVKHAFPDKRITCLQQSGKGKGDAVRAGFAVATGDVVMILDADLTVQPEELPKFYTAIASGRAEFANGVRLVYPMQQEAMRFLNLCANKAFGLIFSWLLGQSVKDTLCGSKAMLRQNYERLAAGRAYFGDFDPFGDFDLLFGAEKLGLRIMDVPIHYGDRTYGSTNIHRWSHGWLLLRMVVFAAKKLKFV